MMTDEPEQETEEQAEPDAEAVGAIPAAPQQDGPPESINLVTEYNLDPKKKDWLISQAKKLIKAVKSDDDSREEWKKSRADEIKLFAGMSEAMKSSQGGGNAPHDPITTRTLLQLWSRGWDQICPAKGTLVQVHPNSPEDEEPAQRRENYMNWQLRHKVPQWVVGHGDSYLRWIMSGSEFREKMWDPVLKTTRFEGIPADDVIVSYSRKDIDPLMADVPRVTRILRLHRWKMEDYGDTGMLDAESVTKVFDKETPTIESDEDESVIEEVGLKVDGIEKPDTITSSTSSEKDLQPRPIYRSQTWLKLPDGKRMRPVMFTVDRKTGIPLALTIREDEDPFDRMRFEAEKEEWNLAAQAVAQQFQQAQMQHQQMVAQGVPAQPPMQPQPPPEPKPVKMKTLYNFIHYRLFPNPAGFYGIGVGFLLKNANLMINKLETEYLLSARYANMQGGLLPKGSNLKRGNIEMEMGKWHETELESEQMGGIKPFLSHPPADGLWKFIEKLRQDCSTLVADVDTMSGEAGPTNETKAAAQQRQANAMALVSVIVRLYLDPLTEEVKMLAHDNRNFMQEREYFYFTEPTHKKPQDQQQAQQKNGMSEVYRSDFMDEFHFTFTADQRLQTQPERVQTSTTVLAQLQQSPQILQSPAGPPLLFAAFMDYFKALDKPELQTALGQPPPPPAPPPPPSPMSQEDETGMFITEKDHPVLPTDNHGEHYRKIQEFKATDYHQSMSSTGKTLLDKHERAHIAALYKADAARANAERTGMGAGPGLGGGPGYGGMAQPPAPQNGGPPAAPPGGMQNGLS